MYKISPTLSLVKTVEVQFMFDGSGGVGDEEDRVLDRVASNHDVAEPESWDYTALLIQLVHNISNLDSRVVYSA